MNFNLNSISFRVFISFQDKKKVTLLYIPLVVALATCSVKLRGILTSHTHLAHNVTITLDSDGENYHYHNHHFRRKKKEKIR